MPTGESRFAKEEKPDLFVAPIQIIKPTPASILQDAVSRGATVETLAKLLELQERWEANEARKAFHEAFSAFKAEAPKLDKTKEVKYPSKGGGEATRYKYTPLDEIASTLAPILSKHGLSYHWKQAQGTEGMITVTCILTHVQGYSEECSLSGPPDTSGSKNAIQSIASGVSYLRRYTLLGALGMATADEDTDGMTMGNATDHLSNIEASTNKEELSKAYNGAIRDALGQKDSVAVKLFIQAKDKRALALGIE